MTKFTVEEVFTIEALNQFANKQGANAAQEQYAISSFNSNSAKAIIKDLSYRDYVSIKARYFKTHYSKFTAAAVGLTIATAYIAALAVSPALFPFGLAALTGYTLYAAAAAALTVAAYTGYVVLPRFFSEAHNLNNRFHKNKLSNYDVALLGAIAVTGVAFIGALNFMPALLPIIGSYAATMSTTAKVVSDAVVAVPTALALYAMFTGRPASGRKPADAALVFGSDANKEGESEEEKETARLRGILVS